MLSRVETKVVAGTAGSGAGSILGQFIDYLLSTFVYHHRDVPDQVSAFVLLACSAGLAYLAAYRAPHTARADDAAAAQTAPQSSNVHTTH